MPTSRCTTPHRALSLLLGVPILLLAFSAHHPAPRGKSLVFRKIPPFSLAHRRPIPIPWEDDVFATGLPPYQLSGKRIARKVVPTRSVLSWKPSFVPRRFIPCADEPSPSIVDSLAESLVLSRPPPGMFLPVRIGGSVGNGDGSHHS